MTCSPQLLNSVKRWFLGPSHAWLALSLLSNSRAERFAILLIEFEMGRKLEVEFFAKFQCNSSVTSPATNFLNCQQDKLLASAASVLKASLTGNSWRTTFPPLRVSPKGLAANARLQVTCKFEEGELGWRGFQRRNYFRCQIHFLHISVECRSGECMEIVIASFQGLF